MNGQRVDSQTVSRRVAEFRARDDFLRALFELAERAKRGEALLPVVPPSDELTYVDGFLVWNGRPVWWSGESGSAAATTGLEGPGIVDRSLVSKPLPAPEPAHTRPSLRRWLRLRWRSLAFGEAM